MTRTVVMAPGDANKVVAAIWRSLASEHRRRVAAQEKGEAYESPPWFRQACLGAVIHGEAKRPSRV